ncbi:uncharacterized protein LOC128218592 [Mya arenaria]|uniref:uncharacterized protein LOC128218592 n=1 Tax=Mya arenaria TaxID=6604 RepID=UPI0022E84ED3|nr:uncharacterized protein LOC128218592 [Mya arenaria]
MLFVFFTVLLYVGASSAARCCLNNTYSATMIMNVARQPPGAVEPYITDQTLDLDFDYDRKIQKMVISGYNLLHPEYTFQTTIYNDYKHSKVYTLFNGTCTMADLAEAQIAPCIPDDFTTNGMPVTIGTGSNTKMLTFYSGVQNGASMTFSFDEHCTPITFSSMGDLPDGTKFLYQATFANIGPLRSADAFDLPDACKHAVAASGN